MARRRAQLSAAALALLSAACGPGDPTAPAAELSPDDYVAPADPPAPRKDLVAIPTTRVRLRPPLGYLPAAEFAGFVHGPSKSSVMVVEIPGPYSQVAGSFADPKRLEAQAMELVGQEPRGNGPHPGVLLRVTQTAQGVVVEKWIWVFGTEEACAMVMGTCFDESFLPELRASVVTAQWDPTAEPAEDEGPGFTLGFTGDLQVWQRMGGTVAYTLDGKPDAKGEGKPMFSIGPALGAGGVADREAFARARIENLPLGEVIVEESETIEIDGLEGIAMVARAADPKTGRTIVAYQALLFEPSNYWIAVGLCRGELESQYLPVFREMVASFRREP